MAWRQVQSAGFIRWIWDDGRSAGRFVEPPRARSGAVVSSATGFPRAFWGGRPPPPFESTPPVVQSGSGSARARVVQSASGPPPKKPKAKVLDTGRGPAHLRSLLGLGPAWSAAELRSAYKRLAFAHHPDRGGSAARFTEITEAYEALSKLC